MARGARCAASPTTLIEVTEFAGSESYAIMDLVKLTIQAWLKPRAAYALFAKNPNARSGSSFWLSITITARRRFAACSVTVAMPVSEISMTPTRFFVKRLIIL